MMMTADPKAAVPANIAEFNTIVGLVFAQLYEAFPVAVDLIDRDGIAKAMGITGEWSAHRLPSGRTFNEMLAYTMAWLSAQRYTISSGAHPAERVTLTDKGLAALNRMPQGLAGTVGSELIKAKSDSDRRDWSVFGDLVGGAIGGFTKSITS
jgi:hypothetical protein